uniref:Uncharacterized protein n=1 Tax=Ditylenchus dipsaci TaxID=166011 RepID=A0A915DX02_9BILA
MFERCFPRRIFQDQLRAGKQSSKDTSMRVQSTIKHSTVLSINFTIFLPIILHYTILKLVFSVGDGCLERIRWFYLVLLCAFLIVRLLMMICFHLHCVELIQVIQKVSEVNEAKKLGTLSRHQIL